MQNLPLYVYTTFTATAFIALWMFYKATNFSRSFLLLMAAWIILQSLLAGAGFYNDPATTTMRFPLLVFPPLIVIILLFATKKGRGVIDGLSLPALTIFHVIRIPVEFVLLWLFVHKSIPEAMTFEGRNFDILSGISAPFIYYFNFVKKSLHKNVLIAWNIICIILLLNVVSSAVLSLPARFAQFGFEQPNLALGYFPFVLLPACLVPLVLFANLAAIRQLIKKKETAVV